MTGQGHNFGGDKAQLLKKRLAEIKRDPNAGRRLFGLPASGGPEEPRK